MSEVAPDVISEWEAAQREAEEFVASITPHRGSEQQTAREVLAIFSERLEAAVLRAEAGDEL